MSSPPHDPSRPNASRGHGFSSQPSSQNSSNTRSHYLASYHPPNEVPATHQSGLPFHFQDFSGGPGRQNPQTFPSSGQDVPRHPDEWMRVLKERAADAEGLPRPPSRAGLTLPSFHHPDHGDPFSIGPPMHELVEASRRDLMQQLHWENQHTPPQAAGPPAPWTPEPPHPRTSEELQKFEGRSFDENNHFLQSPQTFPSSGQDVPRHPDEWMRVLEERAAAAEGLPRPPSRAGSTLPSFHRPDYGDPFSIGPPMHELVEASRRDLMQQLHRENQHTPPQAAGPPAPRTPEPPHPRTSEELQKSEGRSSDENNHLVTQLQAGRSGGQYYSPESGLDPSYFKRIVDNIDFQQQMGQLAAEANHHLVERERARARARAQKEQAVKDGQGDRAKNEQETFEDSLSHYRLTSNQRRHRALIIDQSRRI
ncbi:hypothetical protein T439DRAFT_353178 [Meredithblackwellia eburnea MCA 4105]